MIKESILSEFDREMATTRKLLERIPDDKFAWKPHDKSMSLGQLATHVATLPGWGEMIMNGTSVDIAGARPPQELTSRAAILEAFEQVRTKTRAALDKSDGEYGVMWSLKREGHEMFSMPRIGALRAFVLSHGIHHRGQLSVYLRLNDVAVPSIYGPSADEPI